MSSCVVMADAQITVRLQARARRDQLVELRDGVLVARVTAPPVDERANRALCSLVARQLRVAPSRVAVVRGEKSRNKRLRIEGFHEADLGRALLNFQPRDKPAT